MKAALTNANVIESLVAAVPEIEPLVRNHDDEWAGESPGLHILFGEIVSHYVLPRFAQPDGTDETLARLLAFFERMLDSGDDAVTNIVEITVAEQMSDEADTVLRAHTMIGPRLRDAIVAADAFWRRTET